MRLSDDADILTPRVVLLQVTNYIYRVVCSTIVTNQKFDTRKRLS